MTVQIAAASTALILGEDRRRDGRWVGWKRDEPATFVASSGERKAHERAGLILDQLGREGLEAVRDGRASLNAKYEDAVTERDRKASQKDYQQRLEAEEADAKTFIAENAPDLASRVDGEDLQSYVEARDIWNRRNREEADRIREEKAKKEKEEADRRKSLQHTYSTIARALQVIGGYGQYDATALDRLMAEYSPEHLQLADHAQHFNPKNLRSGISFLNHILDYQEKNND